MTSAHESAPRTSHSDLRWRVSRNLGPGWLGLGVSVAWLLYVAFAHWLANQMFGPKPLPFGPAHYAWNMLVNAALLGFVVGGAASLKRSVGEDLRELQPILPNNGETLESVEHRIGTHSRRVGFLATLVGVISGVAVATLDPRLRDLYGHLSLFDPRYITFVTQNILFAVFLTRLFVSEIHMTRAYARLGEQVEVNLLAPTMLLVFGRKGLRSVVLWVSISTLFSMFWVLDSAGQANPVLAIAVLALAIVALIAPTMGIRRNISVAKAAELEVVSQALRSERDAMLSPQRIERPVDDGRLGSLIQYHAFVKSVREWPFDLSTVSRSLLFIALGVGSWLGGAVVERLLDQLLG